MFCLHIALTLWYFEWYTVSILIRRIICTTINECMNERKIRCTEACERVNVDSLHSTSYILWLENEHHLSCVVLPYKKIRRKLSIHTNIRGRYVYWVGTADIMKSEIGADEITKMSKTTNDETFHDTDCKMKKEELLTDSLLSRWKRMQIVSQFNAQFWYLSFSSLFSKFLLLTLALLILCCCDFIMFLVLI